jgi:hypothetical protein
MPDTIDDVDEHPIIFNDWSIRRILAGEKTQARRVIDFSKFDPLGQMDMSPGKFEFEGLKNGRSANFREPNGAAVVHCPYGQPGDVLWVREAFRFIRSEDDSSPNEVVDRYPNGPYELPCTKYEAGGVLQAECQDVQEWGRKRPSIHMPRELHRLRLRVEDVRVERVQQISQEDAKAEGCERTKRAEGEDVFSGRKMVFYDAPTLHFQHKWNDLHGDSAWERNEWVWVVEFSRIDE